MDTKVSIVRCADYNQTHVYEAVKQSIDLLGGIETFVQRQQKVLIKPNLIKIAHPEEAVTTHPELVRAVIRLVKKQTDKIFIGDSPGGLVKTEAVYDKCGISQIAREEKVKLVKFDRIASIDNIFLAKIKDEVDVCISLPKFKTHNLTTITAAVKNVFGLVPGLYKVQCHKEAPNYKAFSLLLAKIYGLAKPQLSVIDSILAMEGEGPNTGTPRRVGLILASGDGVAIDAVLAKLIGLKALDVPSTKEAYRLRLGQADLKRIEISGESLDKILIKDFKLPKICALYRMPNFITRFLGKVIPLLVGIDCRRCNHCLMCKNICPQQAIKENNGKLKISPQRCMLCLCCGEVCPENAIYMRFFNRRLKS